MDLIDLIFLRTGASSIFLLLFCLLALAFAFAFGCQSAPGSSEETSLESGVSCVSLVPMQFESTEKLINYLRDCRNETYGQDFSVKNYIKDGVVIVYEPSFTPPDGFRFAYVEIGYYCTYTYYTDAWTTSHEHKMSSMFESARAAAQSKSFPGS